MSKGVNYVSFSPELVVDIFALVEVLAAEEPDEILPCLLGGHLIWNLRPFTFGGYSYSSVEESWS